MTNRHSFNSYKSEETSFEPNLSGSSTSFNSYIGSTRNFNLYLDGYDAVLTWLLKLRMGLNIAIDKMHLLSRFSPSIALDFAIESLAKIKQKIYPEISGSVGFVFVMKMFKRMGDAVIDLPFSINTDIILKRKMGNVTIGIPEVMISASPICKKYYLLNYYDSDLLSALDSTLLIDMDYTTV